MFHNYEFNKASNKHTFEIHDVEVSIVNGIRRVILTDIPIPGIIGEDSVTTPTIQIKKNNGPLHNEIIAHRIGLIPICLTEDMIESYEDNSITLELNVTNSSDKTLDVTTADITGSKSDVALKKNELDKMFPANEITKNHILITRLRPNESLHFEAKLVKKTARFNSAFCPVSLANFFYIQDESVAKEKDNILDKERSYCVNKSGDANKLQFEIEPINNNIGPKYLINKALEIIEAKLIELMSNIKLDNFPIKQFEDLKNTYEFTIENEDDTLGNIIQTFIHNKHVRSTKGEIDGMHCSYIGYICPHPLKTELIIRITLDEKTDKNDFIRFLHSTCHLIIEQLSDIKTEWNKFVKLR